MTDLPVLGVPVQATALAGLDALLSIVQMPAGVPVGTLAVGPAGARNAGLLAARILALSDPGLAERVTDHRVRQTESVPENGGGRLSVAFPFPPVPPSAFWAAASLAACWRWPRHVLDSTPRSCRRKATRPPHG
jgi:hypothetical protein